MAQAGKIVQAILETMTKEGTFGRNLGRVKVISSGNGELTASLKVEKEDSNSGGTLHGAMSSLLVDGLSTAALMTHPKCQSPGVSININMVYLKAVPIGEEVLIKDKIGGRLAFLSVDIFNKNTGDILVKGSHTKYIGS